MATIKTIKLDLGLTVPGTTQIPNSFWPHRVYDGEKKKARMANEADRGQHGTRNRIYTILRSSATATAT